MGYKAVSFFAGCGGLDLGFRQAGFNVVWANENDPNCKDTYIRNHPTTKYIDIDIHDINCNDIPDADGFIGGPPCQAWSIGGKQKGLEDERGNLFIKYIDIICIKKTNFFVIENVKGILDQKFKDSFKHFISTLKNAGYDVHWSVLNAIHYNVPQNRERIFIIGFNKNLSVHYEFPISNHQITKTLLNAIGDIRVKPTEWSSRLYKNYLQTPLPNHDVLMSSFGSFYYRGNRRRNWNQPSFTINATADFIPLHPSSPKMIYYGRENWTFQKERISEYRRLSVRECARIQSFPDDFIFDYKDINAGYRMVGNAVPPLLGKEIALSILNALNKATVKSTLLPTYFIKKSVLVGYYKNIQQFDLILKHKLYYIRADGRPGSILPEDLKCRPDYLLLHNTDVGNIYELEDEKPQIVSQHYLANLGFKVSGARYLCFKLNRKMVSTPMANLTNFIKRSAKYAPFLCDYDAILQSK